MHLFWLFQILVVPGPSRPPYTRNISSNNGAFIFRPFSFCCGLASLFESPLCRPLSVHLALYVCPLTFSLLSAKRPPFFPFFWVHRTYKAAWQDSRKGKSFEKISGAEWQTWASLSKWMPHVGPVEWLCEQNVRNWHKRKTGNWILNSFSWCHEFFRLVKRA